jgi:DNA invertase Pin-like site-specific DNA recombinase
MSTVTTSLRAAYYGRVSTAEQVEGTSLETQRHQCLNEIAVRGWELVGEFVDEGVSGAKGSRPELDRLLTACRRKEIQAVVVAKLDRFGRSLNHLTTALSELEDLGVIFYSVFDKFESNTTSGRLHRNILGTFAEFEREQIRDRTMAGLIAVARQGFWRGGPAPYGFRLEKDCGHTRLMVDEAEAEMLRLAVREIIGGRSIWKTAQLLNSLGYRPRTVAAWTEHRLRRTLKTAQISGTWAYGRPNDESRGLSEGDFTISIPAIISEEDHAELRRILFGKYTDIQRKENKLYILSKGVLTSPCGKRMRGMARTARGSRWYVCPGSEVRAGSAKCDCRKIHSDWIDELVWREVRNLLGDTERLLALAEEFLGRHAEMNERPDDPKDIDGKIEQLELARTTRVAGALKVGIDPELLKAVVTSLDEEIEAWRKRLDQVRELQQLVVDTHGRISRLQKLAERAGTRLDSLSPSQKRTVIEALELKVQVVGWHSCVHCGGAGKTSGGCGGTPCPSCHMVRYVPELRVDGVWTSDLDAADETQMAEGAPPDVQHSGRLELPFSFEAA